MGRETYSDAALRHEHGLRLRRRRRRRRVFGGGGGGGEEAVVCADATVEKGREAADREARRRHRRCLSGGGVGLEAASGGAMRGRSDAEYGGFGLAGSGGLVCLWLPRENENDTSALLYGYVVFKLL